MNAPPRPGRRPRPEGMPRLGRRPRLGVLAPMLVTFALVLAAGPADSAPASTPAARAASTARVLGKVSVASCDPKASSLRPSGPPQVTPGSFMAKIRARGYLIAGVDQDTCHFGYLDPFTGQGRRHWRTVGYQAPEVPTVGPRRPPTCTRSAARSPCSPSSSAWPRSWPGGSLRPAPRSRRTLI